MKTSELTGVALDWAVAEASGTPIYRDGKTLYRMDVDGGIYWQPSIDWAQGGAIIEREGMGVWMYQWNDQGEPESGWYAEDKDGDHVQKGAAPLTAAMRSYVASKLGDDVEIPASLNKGE